MESFIYSEQRRTGSVNDTRPELARRLRPWTENETEGEVAERNRNVFTYTV